MTTETQTDLSIYLEPTFYLDSDHPEIIAFALDRTKDAKNDIEKAVKLYYAVRDEFKYDAYNIDLSKEAMQASATLIRGSGYCGEKANLLAAAARAVGIPSRLAFANVKNHLSTDKLIRALRSDVFVFHGYTELFVNGKWVKATPAFNLSMCQKFKVPALEFDGENDSIFQQFDANGNQFMDYLKDHGHFPDVPRDLFVSELIAHYPHLFEDVKDGEQEFRWTI